MRGINLTDAKAHLSELVSKAQSGEETVITRRGKPVARIVPMTQRKKALASRAAFRASLPPARHSSADILRALRDESY